MKKVISITILITFFLQSFALADLKENVNFYSSTISKLNTPAKKNNTCYADIKESKNCSFLFNLFERDQSTGMFFGMISDSPWDSCKKAITQNKNLTTNELEAKYSKHERTALGLRPGYFSGKMEQCFNSKNKKLSANDLDIQNKMIVSMGYDYLNRINQSNEQLSNEVKSINNLLGEPIEKAIPCADFNLTKDKKICDDIKNQNCKSKGEIAAFSDQLYESAIEPVIALQKRLRTLRGQVYGRGGTPKSIRDEIKKIENSIIFLEEQNPIIKGKNLKPFIESLAAADSKLDKSKLQSAVKEQLIENRKKISEKLNENVDMNRCILYGDDTYCKHFAENSERLPLHDDIMFFEKGKMVTPEENKKNYAATEFYNANQCMDNYRGLKKEFNSFATDFSVNVGLTLLSGGLGLAAKIGQGAKIALYSERAIMAIDAGFLGTGVKEAADNCSKELNKLEIKNSDTNKNSCPVSMTAPESTVVANYQSCVTGAMLASLNALPIVPIAVSKYLSRKTLISDLPKDTQNLLSFKSPRKATDTWDLKSAGTILPNGKVQNAAKVFDRDGVYVYIIDEKGNMVISHRTPDLNAGTKDTDQFLGTHRGLYNKLAENGSNTVVAAGEIRVIGGRPITVSPRAGSFHNTPEDILLSLKAANPQEQKAIDKLLAEYKTAPKDDPFHMEDFIDAHPELKATYDKVQKQLKELTDKRLAIAKDSMAEKGLISKDSHTEFTSSISGDAHVEGKAAAVAEIECSKNKSCANQIAKLREGAAKFLAKYKTPKETVNVVFTKFKNIDDPNKLPERDRAFYFFQRRSELLFKEGPIEFIQNSRPETYGLSMEKAMQYFDEWAKQFNQLLP